MNSTHCVASCIIALLFAVCYYTTYAQPAQVAFTLLATELNGCDDTSACDGKVKISCASVHEDWKQCGMTSEVPDDNYPIWSETFTFDYNPTNDERWKFDVLDVDVLFDDTIGVVMIGVGDFLNRTQTVNNTRLQLPDSRGSLYVVRRQLY